MLSIGAENAVIDELHHKISGNDRWKIEQGDTLQVESGRPENIGKNERRSEQGVGPQQEAEGEQRERAAARAMMNSSRGALTLAKAKAAASSYALANRISRQITPTMMKSGA